MISFIKIKEEVIDPEYIKIEQAELEKIKDEPLTDDTKVLEKKICQYCGKTFLNDYIMKLHLRMHVANNSCSTVLTVKSDVQPVSESCEDKFEYKCQQCDISFEYSKTFKSHMELHEDYFPFECEFCPSTFNQATALKHHNVVHSSERIECNQCNKSFSSHSTYKRHITHIHNAVTRFKCNLCGAIFPSENAYKDHLVRHKQNPKLVCEKCHKHFSNHSFYWKHTTMFDHVFKCDKCKLSFISQHSLQIHSKRHVMRGYQCKHCLKFFKLPVYLKNHLKKSCRIKVDNVPVQTDPRSNNNSDEEIEKIEENNLDEDEEEIKQVNEFV